MGNDKLWFKTRESENRQEIFDPVRKKYVALSPEEQVRQQLIQLLVVQHEVPLGLMSVEYAIKVNTLSKRCDIVVFTRSGRPLLIAECKAPQVKLDQKTVAQAAVYNLKLDVDFLIITNGKTLYCLRLEGEKQQFTPIAKIPTYEDMCRSAEIRQEKK